MGQEYKVKWTTEADLQKGQAFLDQQEKIAQATKSIAQVEAQMAREQGQGVAATKGATDALAEHGEQLEINRGRYGAIRQAVAGLHRAFPEFGAVIHALVHPWVLLALAIGSAVKVLMGFKTAADEMSKTSILGETAHKAATDLNTLRGNFDSAMKALARSVQAIITAEETVKDRLEQANKQFEEQIKLMDRLREARIAKRREEIEDALSQGTITPAQATVALGKLGIYATGQKADEELAAARRKAALSDQAVKNQESALAAATASTEALKKSHAAAEAESKAAAGKTGIYGPTVSTGGLKPKIMSVEDRLEELKEKSLDLTSERATQGRSKLIGFYEKWSGVPSDEVEERRQERERILEKEIKQTSDEIIELQSIVKERDALIKKATDNFAASTDQLKEHEAKVKKAASDLKAFQKEAKEATALLKQMEVYLPEIAKEQEAAARIATASKAREQQEATDRAIRKDTWSQIEQRAPLYATPGYRAMSQVYELEGIEGVRRRFPGQSQQFEAAISRIMPSTPDMQRLRTANQGPGVTINTGGLGTPPPGPMQPPNVQEVPPYTWKTVPMPKEPTKPDFGFKGPQTKEDWAAVMKYWTVDKPKFEENALKVITQNAKASQKAWEQALAEMNAINRKYSERQLP